MTKVIPVCAKGSKMIDEARWFVLMYGLPIFPCDPATKRPLIRNGFKAATTDFSLIEQWWKKHPDAMIGLPTGLPSNTFVIDCDTKPEKGIDGRAELAKLEAQHGKLPETPVQETPSGGRHILFRMPAGRSVKCSTSKIAPGIDVRGDGGYIVIAPSVRADGKSYKGIGKFLELPCAEPPAWLLQQTGPSGTSSQDKSKHSVAVGDDRPIGDASLMAPGFEAVDPLTFDSLENAPDVFRMVAEALLAIDNSQLDRQTWVDLSYAVKAAVGGNELFYALVYVPWCLKYPENDEEAAAKLWDSITHSRVGWEYLRPRAREAGWRDPFPEFGDDLTLVEQDIFESYVYVEEIKRFFDCQTRQMVDKEQFRDRHPEYGSPTGKRNAYTAYMTDVDRRRVVARATYRPGAALLLTENGQRVINTWRPSELTPMEGDITPWLGLAELVIPDAKLRETIFDWMAFVLQHPAEKCNWAIALGGGQGIGKDTIFQPVVAGLGLHNASYVRPKDLADGWTDYLERKLVIVEEMANFSKKDIANALKPLIAAPPDVVRINKKFVPQYFIPNIQSWVFFTNKRDAMALEDDDRRCFIYWSPVTEAETKKRTAEEYYTKLHKWLENGGNAHVVHWLLKRDLSNFNPKGHAPDTQAKREMIASNRSPVEAWVRTSIEDEVGLFSRDLVTIEEIIKYAHDAKHISRGVQHGLTENSVASALKAAGALRAGRTRLGRKEGYVRIWALRRTHMYAGLSGAQDALSG